MLIKVSGAVNPNTPHSPLVCSMLNEIAKYLKLFMSLPSVTIMTSASKWWCHRQNFAQCLEGVDYLDYLLAIPFQSTRICCQEGLKRFWFNLCQTLEAENLKTKRHGMNVISLSYLWYNFFLWLYITLLHHNWP